MKTEPKSAPTNSLKFKAPGSEPFVKGARNQAATAAPPVPMRALVDTRTQPRDPNSKVARRAVIVPMAHTSAIFTAAWFLTWVKLRRGRTTPERLNPFGRNKAHGKPEPLRASTKPSWPGEPFRFLPKMLAKGVVCE